MSHYAVLYGKLQRQLEELDLEYQYTLEQAQLAQQSDIDAYWIAAGFGLQGFYTGVEKMFEQIARTIDQSLMKQSDRWHQELLDQMQVAVPGIRPPVINQTLREQLKQYLSFRHVVRSNYTHRLDPSLIAETLTSLPECYTNLQQAIDQFCQFLVSDSGERFP